VSIPSLALWVPVDSGRDGDCGCFWVLMVCGLLFCLRLDMTYVLCRNPQACLEAKDLKIAAQSQFILVLEVWCGAN
jgi:hypothetical protein